jgi:hypothetical protein
MRPAHSSHALLHTAEEIVIQWILMKKTMTTAKLAPFIRDLFEGSMKISYRDASRIQNDLPLRECMILVSSKCNKLRATHFRFMQILLLNINI